MTTGTIRDYLEEQNVKYKIIEHKEAFTAQEIAARAHIPGNQLAKTVMVKVDGKMVMVVLQAPSRVDLEKLKKGTNARQVELASEAEFSDLFPGCDVGAMPPFGHLYDVEVIVDKCLSEEIVIAFCAGSHTELVQISYEDFARLAKPRLLEFCK